MHVSNVDNISVVNRLTVVTFYCVVLILKRNRIESLLGSSFRIWKKRNTIADVAHKKNELYRDNSVVLMTALGDTNIVPAAMMQRTLANKTSNYEN